MPPTVHHPPVTETLSIHDARKLVLLSQWPPPARPAGRAVRATLAAVRHLGYVQIDTISVVERAHHHTLWNRSRRYLPRHLEALLAEQSVFEYWSHAAAYLPMEDYRFSLPRKRAYAAGKRHWYTPDPGVKKRVLERITTEGPLRARDFDAGRRAGAGMWDWKPAKQALEQLFMEGRLMSARRQGFDKVYDLAERVLPACADTRMPGESEYGRFLVTRFLGANGLGRAAEIVYQRGALGPLVERCMARMARRGEIVPLKVRDRTYYALPAALELLNRPLPRKRLRILSPFDNLLIQRERMRHLFDFDYRIECYVPAARRQHGYFSLPLLWDGRLVARMDCKAQRPKRALLIRNLVGEPRLPEKDALIEALVDELGYFAPFNGCERVEVGEVRDPTLRRPLKAALGAFQPRGFNSR